MAYLRREISLEALVEWAESAVMEGAFDERDLEVLRDVVARLGLADVRALGLTWEDCQEMLGKLGYTVHIEIVSV